MPRILIICRLTFLALCFSLTKGNAQKVVIYDFSDSLATTEDSAPPLRILGTPGKFVEELLPELGNKKQKVYQFEANSGLQFDNKASDGFLSKSYTIEIYFRLQELESWKRVLDFKNQKSDNGCYIYKGRLNFFNFATGEKAPVKENEYVHYVFSRDVETHVINMYIDGESKVSFRDPDVEAVIDEDQVLNFFQDDLIAKNETSAGAVALIRLYDRVMTPVFIRQSFQKLAQTITPISKIAQLPVQVPSAPPVVQPSSTTPLVKVSGKVYNGENLDFIEDVDVTVKRTVDDAVVAQTKTTNGTYDFRLRAHENYTITAERPGYESKSIYVRPENEYNEVKTFINLTETTYYKRIFVLQFLQSEDRLIPATIAVADSLVTFLKSNPDLGVELHGHTDNIGNFDKNVDLSRQRADQIKEYLLQRGIDPNRIMQRGYGQTRPIVINSSEENRRLNRRVEVWAKPIKR
jgi:outer membrane protein OmpA-like peptidoglycan-associated protein